MLHVGQFRRIFFKPTETFIYNYLTSFRCVVPVCFTFRRDNVDQFPFQHPTIELYSWAPLQERWRWLRTALWRRFSKDYVTLRYDVPKTFQGIERHGVKVLHAHFGYTGFEMLGVKQKTGLPLVTTFYGEDVSALARLEKWQRAYADLFRQGDLFLVEGPHMRERLVGIGCNPEKIGIQRIAIHVGRYPFRERLPKERGKAVTILFCGSFREKKGLLYALAAIAKTRKRFPGIEFRVIGDGPLRGQVEQTIETYSMQDYTTLLGFQTHQRMIEEMAAADIFIHPSTTADNGDSEGGAPTTILEAQACGIPVLSTLHADIPNVVAQNESALLAPERDVEALSDNLTTLLENADVWGRMGARGHEFVEQYHNIEKEAYSLETNYRTLAGINS